jgi:two-component system OmpR family sensor kinase
VKRLERLPVRWRLALTSAGLTFVILLLFAVVIGLFTARQVRMSFDDDVRLTAVDLQERINIRPTLTGLRLEIEPSDAVIEAATAGGAAVRILDRTGKPILPRDAPPLGPPRAGLHASDGYRVATRPLTDALGRRVAFLQYAKPLESVDRTVARMKLFLTLGVLAGTCLALLAGLAIARRAMAPIAALTTAAKGIARTRDPAVKLPQPAADDEVADLARTLEEMLMALDEARGETQAALDRQRAFVADASHELRTPLTSILANLELLEAQLEGEDAEMAGSALRSSQRMRRLVANLLLLARADAGRRALPEEVDVLRVVHDAAAEAAPLAEAHELTVDVRDPVSVEGSADDLHRLVLNLLENALVHTPEGSHVQVTVRRDGDVAVIEVADDGPGIPPDLREHVFDRFVRRDADRSGGGSGSGLGLAIVRAVARAHGGTVELGDNEPHGARFVVRLPAAARVEQTAAVRG